MTESTSTAPPVFSRVAEILEGATGVPITRIKRDTELSEHLGLNSLDLADVSIVVESDFGISLSDEELEEVSTVGGLVRLIQTKLRRAA